MRNPELNRLRRLFAAVDAGTITVPDEVTEARAVFDRLATPYDEPDLDDLSVQITDAAIAGTTFPTIDTVAATLPRKEAARILEQARDDAHERASYRLVSTVHEMANAIIVDHLRPVHDAAVASLRAGIDTIGSNALDPLELLAAPPKVRDARRQLEDDLVRYQSVLDVLAVISPQSPTTYDTDGFFTFARNGHQLWPKRTGFGASRAPWPEDPIGRMVWLIQHDAQLWCPTGRDRDRAWAEAFPDAPALKGRNATTDGWERAAANTPEPYHPPLTLTHAGEGPSAA